MKNLGTSLLAACALSLSEASVPAAGALTNGWQAGPGQWAVDSVRMDWVDAKRDRTIPVKIYFPKTGEGPFPVILFSHGLGGSREGYGYLGRFWAAHGYVSVHLQHPGSDQAIWQNVPPGKVMETLRKAAREPGNAPSRVADARFAIDQLTLLNDAQGPLHQRLDLQRLGMAGHSFGAMTSLAIAGEVFFTPAGAPIASPDPRVKAIVALSSPVPKNKDQWPGAFAKIRIPCLHMTGTEDDSPIGETHPRDRRVPYDHTIQAEAILVVFRGGDHMVFTGMTRNAARQEQDALIHQAIQSGSLAFWDAYLKGDAAAKAWLLQGGYAASLGTNATFESKQCPQKQ